LGWHHGGNLRRPRIAPNSRIGAGIEVKDCGRDTMRLCGDGQIDGKNGLSGSAFFTDNWSLHESALSVRHLEQSANSGSARLLNSCRDGVFLAEDGLAARCPT